MCLSTIEHLGTGAYEQEAATERRVDLEAMKRLHELTRDRGLLVLTTAVGEPSVDEFGRVYDRVGLDQLLEGWEVADFTLVQRRDPTTWVTIESQSRSSSPTRRPWPVTATRPSKTAINVLFGIQALQNPRPRTGGLAAMSVSWR